MARKLTEVEIHAEEDNRFELDHMDISVDLIDERLYLGNLATAQSAETLEKLKITHVLTLDMVPLPRSCLNRPGIQFEFVRLCDVTREDLISHLTHTNIYIKQAINMGGTILVHCVHGVSRSAAVVISFIMEKYQLCYEEAFNLVRSKRRFVGPNIGFVAQLKLFGHMGFKIDNEDPRYKQFRLRLAGQKFKQVKILPQQFADLVKSDPGLLSERPDPRVYRCKKCRRVLAAQRNVIPHIPKPVKIELARKGLLPQTAKIVTTTQKESALEIIDKLQNLATQILETVHRADEIDKNTKMKLGQSHDRRSTELKSEGLGTNSVKNVCINSVQHSKKEENGDDSKVGTSDEQSSENLQQSNDNLQQSSDNFQHSSDNLQQSRDNLQQSSESVKQSSEIVDKSSKVSDDSSCSSKNDADTAVSIDSEERFRFSQEYLDDVLVDASIAPRGCNEVCNMMVFVEPMSWMEGVRSEAQGRLHCPKCHNKLGNFSWTMGCKCPCGQKVAPAFYLIPSKVEWSNIVKNVQLTV